MGGSQLFFLLDKQVFFGLEAFLSIMVLLIHINTVVSALGMIFDCSQSHSM